MGGTTGSGVHVGGGGGGGSVGAMTTGRGVKVGFGLAVLVGTGRGVLVAGARVRVGAVVADGLSVDDGLAVAVEVAAAIVAVATAVAVSMTMSTGADFLGSSRVGSVVGVAAGELQLINSDAMNAITIKRFTLVSAPADLSHRHNVPYQAVCLRMRCTACAPTTSQT